ncbi:YibE/F family protein [Bacillus marasmi]|uniref:YibE/F family protein n=1 Tax=Bacillus marasmi TaxID=1926279 RepID=UPI0011CB1B51|nr:YibE/F family protein [Bacillus marasmi]
MNVLLILAIILFVLMALIGGSKGARSFLALFFNFAVLFVSVIIMTIPSTNPIYITVIACIVISCINLFFINEVNTKTIIAFVSTMITSVILLFFIVLVTETAMIQGFGEEEVEELSIFSLHIGVDFVKIAASVIIISTIGAIIDVAISIASPMREIYYHNPTITRKSLFLSGLSIGKDILGTSANTLFFAFFGSYLALLIWFKDLAYSASDIVNSKIFSAELINILFAGIGVALNIPITALITAYYLTKKRKSEESVKHI